MDIRRFGAHYRSPRLHAHAHARGLRDLLRHRVPEPRAPGGAAAARLAGLRLAPRARRRVRREVGLGAGQLVRAQRGARATRRCARAAGPGSTGRPRSAPSTAPAARRPRCSTRPRSPRSRSAGPGAAELLERLCDNRVAREVGQDHLHADAQPPRRDRVRLHGHAARRGPLLDRHRHRVRPPRPRLDRARTCPADGDVRVEDVTSRWACFGLWGPRARDVLAAAAPRTTSPSFPLHDAARARRSATCRCARCG